MHHTEILRKQTGFPQLSYSQEQMLKHSFQVFQIFLIRRLLQEVDSSNKCNTLLIFECALENFFGRSVPESLPGSLV